MDLVLAMGQPALEVLAKHGVVPKNRSMSSLRTIPLALPTGAKCLISYSAGIQDVDYAKYIDLLTDCRIAIRQQKTGKFEPDVGKYRYVVNFANAKHYIEERFKAIKKPVPVTIDSETLGLDPYNPAGYIITLQVTYKAGQADVVRFDSRERCRNTNGDEILLRQIKWLLTTDRVTLKGANLKYDLGWFAQMWGITECTNFKFDTMLVGSLLDENRSNSLNVHAKVYTDMGGYDDPFNAKYDKSRMDLVPKDDLLLYGGGDTDACYRVAERMREDLVQDGALAKFYTTILHPAARAYETVERVGWCVDKAYYEFLKDELEYDIAGFEESAREILGGRIVNKHQKEDGHLNLTKASLLTDFMFSPMGLNLKPKVMTPKSGKPSTALDHLLMFIEHPDAKPFVSMLKAYNSAVKTYGTYVVGFMKHIRADGRFHPTYFMYSGEQFDDEGGTVTGRLSVKDPAIQTIPKLTSWAKRLRKAFIAPPGMLILSNDYTQGELKIAACLANEKNMIEAYRNGIDLHAITAARLSGWTLENFLKLKETDPDKFEAIRFLGKAGNFGLIYGMGAEGFTIYALENYGVKMSLDEGEQNRDAFFELYPGLIPWHKQYRDFAYKHKYVRSPLGRVRHLPLIDSFDRQISSKAGRQAINSPVQATLSDMALWSTALMWERGHLTQAPVFGMIHDQLLRYIPQDNYEKYVAQSKDIMENLPFEKLGWKPQLRFTVDSGVGTNLGELKKA